MPTIQNTTPERIIRLARTPASSVDSTDALSRTSRRSSSEHAEGLMSAIQNMLPETSFGRTQAVGFLVGGIVAAATIGGSALLAPYILPANAGVVLTSVYYLNAVVSAVEAGSYGVIAGLFCEGVRATMAGEPVESIIGGPTESILGLRDGAERGDQPA